MSRLQWVLCGIALTLGACSASTGNDPEAKVWTPEDQQTLESLPPYRGHASVAGETCTEVLGLCKVVAQCEGIHPDTRQMITETCCTPNGVCEVEHYGLCGC